MTSPARPMSRLPEDIMLMAARSCMTSFRRDRLRADAARGKHKIFRNILVEVVAYHQPVEMLATVLTV
jgi:hypothetical protein